MKLARVLAAVLTIASLVIAARLRLSRDLTELFPRTPEASELARVTRVFGGGDVSLVLLRGDDPKEVEHAADHLAKCLLPYKSIEEIITTTPSAEKLSQADPTSAWRFAGPTARRKLARAISDEGMRERLRETRALLLAPGSGEAADWLARDPLRLSLLPWEDRIELASGARGLPGGAFVAEEGRARLIVIVPRGRAFDSDAAKAFTADVEPQLDGARAAFPRVTIDFTGGHVVASQTEAMMKSDLTKSGVLSIVLASALFVVLFRRPRALVAVLPPLLAGTLWTTALACLLYPRLSAIATAFAAVVIGVGVDTGVHVYGKLLDARRAGAAPREAATTALAATWRPTLGAAVAAGAAFACLALSEVEGMRQLGILCGAGEVLTAVAILIFVPPIGACLERGPPPPPLRLPGVAAITATRPRALFALAAAAIAIAIALAYGTPRIDHAVAVLDKRELPALGTYEAIDAAFGGTRGQLVVVSADADEERARARADAVAEAAESLFAHRTIAGYDALASVAPSIAAQRARLRERDALDLPSRRAALAKLLADERFASEMFAPALDAFAHPAYDVAEISPKDGALAWLVRRHLGHDDHGAIAVTYVRLTGNAAEDDEARATIRAADPESILTGFADLERSLTATLARDLPRVLLAATGMVVFVLAISLRRMGAVFLALAVLVVEIAIVLLAARAFGVHWHVYDALVLPVLLGITLDEALFLLEASEKKSIDDALSEQAPLATTTALTTAAGFGALVVCRFGGLVDVGKVGALGSTAGLVCALVIIPAGLRLARARRKRAA